MHKPAHKFALFFMVVFLIAFSQSPAIGVEKDTTPDWKLYKEKDGIKGYERNVEGSKYLETKAETVIDAPMEVVLEVLMDIPSFSNWMFDCLESIPLEQTGLHHRILYYKQHSPFPTKDRDAIIKSVTIVNEKDPRNVVTKLESIDNYDYKEAPENTTRMIKFKGEFDLLMLARNRTRVTYTAFSEPGGFAPTVIASKVIRKVSFITTKNLIEKSKEEHYIEKAKDGEAQKQIEENIREGRIQFTAEAK